MKTGIQILDNFIEYISVVKNYSNTTIREYAICIKIFFKFIIEYLDVNIEMCDMNIFLLSRITKSDINAFLTYLSYYRKNASTTRKISFAAIKCFFNWVYEKYNKELKGKQNPIMFRQKILDTFRLPKYLSLNEALEIQNIFNKGNSKNYERDNALIVLFLNTGLRLSEVSNLNINNLDLKNKLIHNVICKGNKERTIFLNDKVIKYLKKYLKTRTDDNKALFISSRETKLSGKSIEYICEKAFRLAGLSEYGYTVHTLRHTFAVQMYKKTKDILIVKELLGHESIMSTEIYTHIENKEVRSAVDKNPLNII